MLLQHSRRDARVGPAGELVLLEDQDRSAWDRAAIEEGVDARPAGLGHGCARSLRAPGAIAAVHAVAERPGETDWPQIASLYGALGRAVPSPVIELNRAVAIAMADGPAAGLVLMDRLDASGELDGYYLLHSARADLLRRLDRRDEAAEAYRRALELATNPVERAFLEARIREVSAPRR